MIYPVSKALYKIFVSNYKVCVTLLAEIYTKFLIDGKFKKISSDFLFSVKHVQCNWNEPLVK